MPCSSSAASDHYGGGRSLLACLADRGPPGAGDSGGDSDRNTG